MVKRRHVRSVGKENFIPSLKNMKSWRNGNKISRFFRHIFEHKKLNRILGVNLVVIAIMFPKLVPSSAYAATPINTINAQRETPIQLKTERSIQSPLSTMYVNQKYFKFHPALDLKSVSDNPIKPAMIGTIVKAEYSKSGYGNVVIVDHGDGVQTLYAHMKKILVKVGDIVDLNTTIGLVGSTGRSTGPHLHFEVRANGIATNPSSIFPSL